MFSVCNYFSLCLRQICILRASFNSKMIFLLKVWNSTILIIYTFFVFIYIIDRIYNSCHHIPFQVETVYYTITIFHLLLRHKTTTQFSLEDCFKYISFFIHIKHFFIKLKQWKYYIHTLPVEMQIHYNTTEKKSPLIWPTKIVQNWHFMWENWIRKWAFQLRQYLSMFPV